MNEKVKEYFSDNRRTALTVFAVIAVIVLVIGLCLSWFVENKRLETVGEVAGPSEIKVLGPNATGLEEIDLAYEPTEFPDHEVKLTRTFSVVSGKKGFTLQVAHTTNIADLDIKLYRVNDVSGTSAVSSADVSQIDSDGNKYSWNKKGESLFPSSGEFTNPADSSNTLGEDKAGEIFGGKPAQTNAIPLYWQLQVTDTDKETEKYKDADGNNCHVTNFIIDLTWTDSAKETDVLYLIAKS